MTGLVLGSLYDRDNIEQVTLSEMDGAKIKPIWVTRFVTKSGKEAHKILFTRDGSFKVYSAFTNDQRFNQAVDEYLNNFGIEGRAKIPREDQEYFTVRVRKSEDGKYKFVYLNPNIQTHPWSDE